MKLCLIRLQWSFEDVAISMTHYSEIINYDKAGRDSSQEVKDAAMRVTAGLVEDVQEQHASSCTETSVRGWNSTSCLLEFGHINWPANPKTHRRIITVEYGAFLLVLFLAAGLGCSLFQIRCREDDPHELLLAESQVYLKENIIHIKEEKHCVEHIRLNSSRVVKKQSSDVKVKSCCMCIQKSDFWNLLPFKTLTGWIMSMTWPGVSTAMSRPRSS